MDELAVTVIGNDRPGIVTSVTKVLYEHGCNLEDASSTILRGHFAMMLMVRAGSGFDLGALRSNLDRLAEQNELVISARPVPEVAPTLPYPSHMVSVYGSDKPGIVYRVAEALSQKGINITELTSRVIGR